MLLPCYVSFRLVKPGREVSCAWLGDSVSTKMQGAPAKRDGFVARPASNTDTPRPPGAADARDAVAAREAVGTEMQAAQAARSAEVSAELASVAASLAQGEDVFSEIPTVANRANPTLSPSQPSETDKDGGQGLGGAGAYRMVRPAISDRIGVPSPAGADRTAGNRVVIGVARK